MMNLRLYMMIVMETNRIFVCSDVDNPKYHDIINSIDDIEKKLVYSYELDFSNFEDNLVLYEDENNEAVKTKTAEKIIEFPIKRILSYQFLSKKAKKAINLDESEDGVSYMLYYSDRDNNNKRYVNITSQSSFVKINQIFATI